MLSKFLHPFPSVLVNDSGLGVRDDLPLILWLIYSFVYLVTDCGGHKVYRTACILLIDKNAGDCFLIPSVWVCVLFPCLSAERSIIRDDVGIVPHGGITGSAGRFGGRPALF